jgi:hypothetical protein
MFVSFRGRPKGSGPRTIGDAGRSLELVGDRALVQLPARVLPRVGAPSRRLFGEDLLGFRHPRISGSGSSSRRDAPTRRRPLRDSAQCESAAAALGVETPASLEVAVNELGVLAYRAEDSKCVGRAEKGGLLRRVQLHKPERRASGGPKHRPNGYLRLRLGPRRRSSACSESTRFALRSAPREDDDHDDHDDHESDDSDSTAAASNALPSFETGA